MTQAFATNPMARYLMESEKKEPLQEAVTHVKDHRGDTWRLRKDLVRNSSHPNYVKPKTEAGIEPSHAFAPGGWHNERTGEVHEGDMRVNSQGVASRGGEWGQTFHITHYDTSGAHQASKTFQG